MSDTTYLSKTVNGLAVVTTPAEVDVSTAGELRAAILAAARSGHRTIVVDMTCTRFCDSSGLHTLLRAYKRVVAQGGELRLAIPADGAVPWVLTLTGIDRFIPCFAGLEEATAPSPGSDNP